MGLTKIKQQNYILQKHCWSYRPNNFWGTIPLKIDFEEKQCMSCWRADSLSKCTTREGGPNICDVVRFCLWHLLWMKHQIILWSSLIFSQYRQYLNRNSRFKWEAPKTNIDPWMDPIDEKYSSNTHNWQGSMLVGGKILEFPTDNEKIQPNFWRLDPRFSSSWAHGSQPCPRWGECDHAGGWCLWPCRLLPADPKTFQTRSLRVALPVSSRPEHLLSMEVDGWDNDRTEGSSSHVWWHRRVCDL